MTASTAYFQLDDDARARGLLQLLTEDGSPAPGAEADLAGFDRATCRRLYEDMLRIRVTDARMMALQRQGRIGFYGEALGQEAAVIGSAAASLPDDWIIPALREAGVGLCRGMTLDSYVAQIMGNGADPTKGRQLPCHPCDRAHHYVVMSSCVSTQIPHAVGIAMAMKLTGTGNEVAFGFMGDGGTSSGEFHVAMNFAGVTRAPCVLICQNNQWAISTPGSAQTAAETIALKAIGYGLPVVRADGNDVFAVLTAVRHAAERARRGEGASFVELLTYRVSAHSSSDDPSRYRDERVTDDWRGRRDPLRRMRAWLEAHGWLDAAEHEAMAAILEGAVRDAITRQEATPMPALGTIFDDVYEQPTWLQRDQLVELQAAARVRAPHSH